MELFVRRALQTKYTEKRYHSYSSIRPFALCTCLLHLLFCSYKRQKAIKCQHKREVCNTLFWHSSMMTMRKISYIFFSKFYCPLVQTGVTVYIYITGFYHNGGRKRKCCHLFLSFMSKKISTNLYRKIQPYNFNVPRVAKLLYIYWMIPYK